MLQSYDAQAWTPDLPVCVDDDASAAACSAVLVYLNRHT